MVGGIESISFKWPKNYGPSGRKDKFAGIANKLL